MKHVITDWYFEDLCTHGYLNRRDMLTLLALAGGGLIIGCATNPVTGQRQLNFMSPSQEIAVDKQHAPDQISQDYGRVQDTGLQSYVQGVGRGIGKVSHRPEMPYTFNALNANYVNAYAFPGGTIGITRGILLSLENESELAALIGHEVGHISARHTAQQMSKQTLAGIAVAGVGILLATQVDSDAAALALGLGGIAAGLLLAKYSRSDERQADALGLEYMCKAGHNPNGMVRLMDMLRGLSKTEPSMVEQMFSSHPMSTERYNSMRREVETRYTANMRASVNRERYMDATARLRKLKPAIDKQKDAEEALIAKKYREGEALLHEALKIAPNDYTGLVLMAKAKIIQENDRGAIPYLDRAIAAYPGEPQAKQLRGVVDARLGNKQAALQHFHECAARAPDSRITDRCIAILEAVC
ncbi:MAG: peptidase M48 Ste24p [Deltaproteobacteria bacterium]|nr:peptidase M48 Ste24p [Deltaproteobacteria bacterium]